MIENTWGLRFIWWQTSMFALKICCALLCACVHNHLNVKLGTPKIVGPVVRQVMSSTDIFSTRQSVYCLLKVTNQFDTKKVSVCKARKCPCWTSGMCNEHCTGDLLTNHRMWSSFVQQWDSTTSFHIVHTLSLLYTTLTNVCKLYFRKA